MMANEVRVNSKLTQRNLKIYYQYFLLFFVLLLFTGPLLWMLSTMLKSPGETYNFPITYIPENLFNFSSFERLFQGQPNLPRWILNSFIIAISVSVGSVLSSSMVAYGFARFDNKAKNFLFLIVLSTLMIPATVLVIPSFMLFMRFGWIDSWLPLIVPSWLGGAYYIFLFRQFFLTIPRELDEATFLDGGGRGTVFFKVILPLSKPVIMTVFIFAFVFSWLDFFGPFLFIRTSELFTLSVGLQLLIGQESTDLPALAAGSFISIIPIAIIYFFAQRYIVEGVVLTGTKG